MKIHFPALSAALLCLAAPGLPLRAAEPAKTTTNSIGMEFILVPAGEFVYGRFAAPLPAGGRAVSGLSEAQFAAVTKLGSDVAGAEAAVTSARAALAAGSVSGAPRAQIEALAAAVAEKDLALAQARAGGFAAIQSSSARLDAAQRTRYVQQVAAAAAAPAGRGGRGGGGGDPAIIAEVEAFNLKARSEWPGFTVSFPRPYYLGKFEVTQEQWRRVMGSNPSTFQTGKFGIADSDRHPVESITWEEAKAFVARLNQLEGTDVYRLPTEFEWEYAGRAGAPEDPTWEEIRLMASQAGRGGAGGGSPTTNMIGTRNPNPWGFHDMLGNVWEWVEDYYNEKLYNDRVPPRTGTVHVIKGGAFPSDVKNLVYSTHGAGPAEPWEVGFRILREAR